MRRIILIGFALLLIAIGAGYLKREPLALAYLASKQKPVPLAEHQTFLRPFVEFRFPENAGEGPLPATLLFHGCAGYRPAFMDHWSKIVNDAGHVAVRVDSLAPRGIDRETALQTVCEGQTLIGQERAADVLAAVAIALDHPRIDRERIVFAGWSHGAWSVMDYMTMSTARPPVLIADADELPKPDGLILFYPYCGLGAHSRFAPWTQTPDAVAFIAGKDTIVNAEECTALVDKLNRAGGRITTHFYPDADHVFDDPSLSPEHQHYYDADAAKDSADKVAEFLQRYVQ